jgi:DNA polymerase III subunit epsilon
MPFSLIQSLRETPLAFLDFETTGASAELGDRGSEIGIVRIERGQRVASYTQLIDPQRRISAGVIALTGITPDMVAAQPCFKDQCNAMLDVLRGAAVIGHNIRFDLSFLTRELRRCGVDIVDALADAPVFDTVRIARRRFGRSGNGLQRLAPRLGIHPSIAHRALADAITTAGVFEQMLAPVGGWGMCLCDVMREQGGPMKLLPATTRQSLLPLELEEALDQKCSVLMEYVDANHQRTQRLIDPQHVRRRNGELVLVAHCHLRNELRTFKLDQIVQLIRPSDAAPASPPACPVVAPAPLELFPL